MRLFLAALLLLAACTTEDPTPDDAGDERDAVDAMPAPDAAFVTVCRLEDDFENGGALTCRCFIDSVAITCDADALEICAVLEQHSCYDND